MESYEIIRFLRLWRLSDGPAGLRHHTSNTLRTRGGVLPYITYIGMCRCEGYGFQAVWSGIGYRNQGVLA